jgi:hypothetical protein
MLNLHQGSIASFVAMLGLVVLSSDAAGQSGEPIPRRLVGPATPPALVRLPLVDVERGLLIRERESPRLHWGNRGRSELSVGHTARGRDRGRDWDRHRAGSRRGAHPVPWCHHSHETYVLISGSGVTPRITCLPAPATAAPKITPDATNRDARDTI